MTDALLIETTTGAVRGYAAPDGSHLFAGIPFAAPPVGELRFRPPQPPQPWQGVRQADSFAPAPAQGISALMPGASQKSSFPSFPTAEIRETSEDCLYLNVWKPTTTAGDAIRPVIVWIYGGGYEAGSAAPPYSDGAALARQTGAVVVAANYRLGALGFLHLADLGSQWAGSTNLALQDQMAALRWVRDNIAAFGGDPGNITVAGQPAGAFSIGALLAAPAAAGLFHKAILQSGSTSRLFDRATATTIAEDLITALRLDDPRICSLSPASGSWTYRALSSPATSGSATCPAAGPGVPYSTAACCPSPRSKPSPTAPPSGFPCSSAPLATKSVSSR